MAPTDLRPRLVHLNVHFPLRRPGSIKLWKQCLRRFEARIANHVDHGRSVIWTTDHNKHGGFPPVHPHGKVIGGAGLDLIGYVPAMGGARVRVLDEKIVDLTIDGHNAHGVKVGLEFPDGERDLDLWVVQCNLGRGEAPESFTNNLLRVKRAFRGRALIGLDEIDEADQPNEHALTRELFPREEDYEIAGWGTYVPTIVPPQLHLASVTVTMACPGMAEVSPIRDIVESTLTSRDC